MRTQAESSIDEARQTRSEEKKGVTRRTILKTAIGSAAALALGSAVFLKSRPTVRLAMIGAGGRGNALALILTWMRRGWPINVDIRHVIDPDRTKASKLPDRSFPRAKVAQDYREALADDQVDAVLIATCDHWHARIAIDAMRSGKAVYCEKPMSITYDEGRQMVDVAATTKAVFQLGTQQKHNSFFRDFAELVLNDRLGEIELVEVLLGRNEYDADAKWCSGLTPPYNLDWNLWVGPTPYREYCPAAMRGWYNIFQFSGGQVLNWGSHHWDIANWILETRYGVNWFGSCEIVPRAVFAKSSELYDVPWEYQVEFRLENRPRIIVASVEKGESTGLRMTGTNGRIFVNRARLSGKPVPQPYPTVRTPFTTAQPAVMEKYPLPSISTTSYVAFSMVGRRFLISSHRLA